MKRFILAALVAASFTVSAQDASQDAGQQAIDTFVSSLKFQSGAIALHAKRGYRVKIVCMSFGERGESQFAWKEPGATLEKVKAGRKDEAERAAKLLGAEIEFFDAGDYPLRLTDAHFDRMVDIYRETNPAFVLTHALEDPYNFDHPNAAHFAQETRVVAQAMGHKPGAKYKYSAPPVYLFEPHQPEQCNFKPDLILKVDEVWEQKYEAFKILAAQKHLWHYYERVAINRGRDDGIRTGMPVVTEGSTLVGTVTSVASNHAWVTLITDVDSAVSSLLLESRAQGVVAGGYDRRLSMEFVEQTAAVREGDTVVTSGLGGTYPPDLVIGKVTRVSANRQELFRSVTVEPLASLSSEGELARKSHLVLDLEAEELTWVVVQSDGASPHEALLRPGEKVRWTASDRFTLTLGNAGGVRVELNGKPQGPFGPKGKVARDIVLKR